MPDGIRVALIARATRMALEKSHDQRGQAAVEYLLAAAIVAFAMIALLAALAIFMPDIVGHVCTSVDPVGSSAAGDCLK
jgi:Flp pilus assembly pilin Flp